MEILRHLEQPMHELHVLSKRKSSINWHIYLKFKITLGLHVSHPVDPYTITSCDMHCMVFWRTNWQFGEIFLKVTAIVLFMFINYIFQLKFNVLQFFALPKTPGASYNIWCTAIMAKWSIYILVCTSYICIWFLSKKFTSLDNKKKNPVALKIAWIYITYRSGICWPDLALVVQNGGWQQWGQVDRPGLHQWDIPSHRALHLRSSQLVQPPHIQQPLPQSR